jgi:hypothetical protein
MTEHTALPLTVEEQRVAREFKRFGATLQKIHPDDDPMKILFTLGSTKQMQKGAAILMTTGDWNMILLMLLGARESGINISGGKVSA